MKISSIDVFVLKTDLDQPFAFSQGWVHQRSATLVRVTTENDIVGWGEAFTQGLESPEVAATVIKKVLSPVLLQRSALDINVLWYEMYNQTRDFGRKGSVMAGISAIDIALWDIAGKFYQQPVHQLLGGAFRSEVQPYATGFYRKNGEGEFQRLAEEAITHKANGFTAMKVKLGFGVRDDIKVMQSIVKALDDEHIELMVDTNHAYGRAEALQLGKALQDYGVRWYEEPLVPEDIEGYKKIRNQLSVPIAAGENEHSVYGFKPLLECIDIAQPDVGSCGGLTAARDISALAQAAGVEVNPHVWGSAIAQAASLQLLASLPVTHHSLFARQPLLEYDCSSHPFRQQLTDTPLKLNEYGMIAVPMAPGLGVEVRMDTVNEFETKD